MLAIVIVIGVLIMTSAFFSGSETALTAVSRPLIHQMQEGGDKRAGVVMRLLERRERLISTILLSNNLVNILASSLATSVLIEAFGSNGVVYATAIMTILIVIYAEVLPKTFALTHTTDLALRAAGIMSVLVWLFRPLNAAMEVFVNGALWLFRVPPTRRQTAQHVLAELRGTIELHMGEQQVKEEVKHERAMLRSVLELAEVEVGQILVHRKKVVTLDADLPIAEIIEQVAGSPYSRIPLWRDQPDNIVGVLHAKNLLRAIESAHGRTDRVDIVAVAQKPWFVPETTRLLDQMTAFRERREHFALVVDEYGALKGIVTLEDIIEEIVGDISDEHDVSIAGIRPQADGSYLIDGSVAIRDLNREFDWSLPDDDAVTVAGLVLYESRMIPEQGQQFMFNGYRLEVVRRQRNQLTLIRVTPPEAPAPGNAEKTANTAA
ncbi:MAG: HlyC/CorC family transporter [Rhodobacteraceae bacterium]|nr:HlyC/CorC family transporter [Paracoccaceae bacterium]